MKQLLDFQPSTKLCWPTLLLAARAEIRAEKGRAE
jgi:hypothetical protein